MRVGKQRWVALGIAASLSACSFPLVHGPKAGGSPTDCTDGRLVPILDTVFAGVMAIAAVGIAVQSDSEWQQSQCDSSDPMCTPAISQGEGALILAPLAILGAAGAYYGWTRTQACRDAKHATEVPPVAAPIVTDPAPVAVPPPTPPTPTPVDPMAPIGPAHGTPTGPAPTAAPADPYGNRPTPAPTTGPNPDPKRTPNPEPKPDAKRTPDPKPVPAPAPRPTPAPKPKPTPVAKPKPDAGSNDAPPAPPIGIPLPGGP